MFVITAVPLGFILAQIVICFEYALGSLLCELAAAISLLKILLVTHFSTIFPYDPNVLGFYVFLFAAVLAFLPSAGICAYQTYHGQTISKLSVYLTKSIKYHPGSPYIVFYIILWTVISLTMMCFALFYIPHYIQKYLNSDSIQVAEAGLIRKQVNIKKILSGFLVLFLALVVHVVSDRNNIYEDVLHQIYASIISLNLMLTFFVLDKDVIIFINSKVLLRIPLFRDVAMGQAVTPIIL